MLLLNTFISSSGVEIYILFTSRVKFKPYLTNNISDVTSLDCEQPAPDYIDCFIVHITSKVKHRIYIIFTKLFSYKNQVLL